VGAFGQRNRGVAVGALDAQGVVDLVVGERSFAGGGGDHEVTDELDLVLERVVGELCTGVRVRGNVKTLTER